MTNLPTLKGLNNNTLHKCETLVIYSKDYKMKIYKYYFLLALSAILLLGSCKNNPPIDVWMVGDSTMAAKSARRHPESGWGVGLSGFVKEKAIVHNHAASGRSTLSFIDEGRWQTVLDSLTALPVTSRILLTTLFYFKKYLSLIFIG
jgi:hypothetical protein